MATYLLVTLFFTADLTASTETLTAGISGYKIRADEIRKKAIAEAEARVKVLGASVATAKKAKLDQRLVGTKNDGIGAFGTQSEKDAKIKQLSKEAADWRDYLSGLKARTAWPQIHLPTHDATPGAVGVFFMPMLVTDTLDAESCRCIWINQGEIVVVHKKTVSPEAGKRVKFAGLYQFTGTWRDSKVFKLVDDLEVGDVDCVYYPPSQSFLYPPVNPEPR